MVDAAARQRARDRAADAFVPHYAVVLGPSAWSPQPLRLAVMTPTERKRRDRARAKAKEQQQ